MRCVANTIMHINKVKRPQQPSRVEHWEKRQATANKERAGGHDVACNRSESVTPPEPAEAELLSPYPCLSPAPVLPVAEGQEGRASSLSCGEYSCRVVAERLSEERRPFFG
jgi:hypothetical protein